MYRACNTAAFTTINNPIDRCIAVEHLIGQIADRFARQRVEALRSAAFGCGGVGRQASQTYWTEHRFDREKARACRHLPQLRNIALSFFLIHDRDSGSDVVAAGQPVVRSGSRDHLEHIADAFGQQQPIEIRREFDQIEQIAAPRRSHGIVEHVGERCAEHPLPAAVLREELRMRLVS